MAEFNHHIEDLITKEGGYVLTDVRGDRGGQTYAGISRRANPNWSGWRYVDQDQTPPRDLVHALYRALYWDSMSLDDVSDDIAEMLLSSAVLSGPRTAAKLLQAALGVTVDGVIGSQSTMALRAADPQLLEARFALARIARFNRIAKDRSQLKFLRGWINRVLAEVKQ